MNALAPSQLATAADWATFLRPVVAAVRNPPSQDEFKARVAAVAVAVHVPASWLLQPWRKAEAMRRFQFWPAVFDIAEMFEEEMREERVRAERRERLALPAPDEERLPPTPEQIAAVQKQVRALTAELAGGPADKAAPVRPAYLSEGALLARYRALADEGNAAAAARVAAIEQRMGADA